MKTEEQKLFKELCKFKNPIMDASLTAFATPTVLGHLFYNRMQGIAYATLKRNGLLGTVNREFRNALAGAYMQNIQKNESFQTCIVSLSEILAACECQVAMLKGAYLCNHYPEGYRTSNDLDLLVLPKDVTTIGNLLTANGFQQGNVRNDAFIPATRKEIIESKMMRGETVPFIKEVNLPFMKFFEVDINFSLDYKSEAEDTLLQMLSNVCIKTENGLSISTLNDVDFFIHLCAHLYKEATTLPWIEMQRDMTLYKYSDIYLLLSEMTDEQLQSVFHRAKDLEMEKICAYAVLEAMALFDIDRPFAKTISSFVLASDPTFCLRVVSPKDKKIFLYQTPDATNRFFMDSRVNDLKEVIAHEKTEYAKK